MTPERIYDWMDSLRADVLARERRAMTDAERASAVRAKAEFETKQWGTP